MKSVLFLHLYRTFETPRFGGAWAVGVDPNSIRVMVGRVWGQLQPFQSFAVGHRAALLFEEPTGVGRGGCGGEGH